MPGSHSLNINLTGAIEITFSASIVSADDNLNTDGSLLQDSGQSKPF